MKMAAFTALNGGSPKATEGINGSADVRTRGSCAERVNGEGSTNGRGTGEVSISQREREGWSSAHDRPPYPPTSYPDVEGGSHKRKRSYSDEEPRRDSPPAQPPQPQQQHHHQPQRLPSPQERQEHGPHRPQSESRDHQGPSQRTPPRGYADEGQHGDRDLWSMYRDGRDGRDMRDVRDGRDMREDRGSAYDQPYSPAPASAFPDDHGDGLRRSAVGDQGDSDYGQSPEGDDRSIIYQGQYTAEQRRDGLIQSDPKKRKRNFSNRTKTGCLTCRRRKKKCDESKPECNNCIRGGFTCSGYQAQKGSWALIKPETLPKQQSIESKDPNYVPRGAYGMPQEAPYPNPSAANHPRRDPLPYNRGQPPLRIDPPQGRPLHSDDDRPTASTLTSALTASTDHKLSAMSAYTNPANAFPTPVSAACPGSAFAERTPKDYQRVPPLHDLSRTKEDAPRQVPPPPPPPPPSTTLPQIGTMLHSASTAPSPDPRNSLSISTQPPPGGVQATAALALSHTQFPPERPRNEKEEMQLGRPYYPFDKELVLERERCSAACWRFNNSTNPNLGVSPAERARLFRDILHPREGVVVSPGRVTPVTREGRVGDNVVVEAPFTCDYGYNIRIGHNVAIGRNMQINDAREVDIGNNVIFSPNVCIYTGKCDTNPQRRNGARGPQTAARVVIEDDVWIAANVIILAGDKGITIGARSTIGAGTVVTRNIPANTIWYGEKARLMRGINTL